MQPCFDAVPFDSTPRRDLGREVFDSRDLGRAAVEVLENITVIAGGTRSTIQLLSRAVGDDTWYLNSPRPGSTVGFICQRETRPV